MKTLSPSFNGKKKLKKPMGFCFQRGSLVRTMPTGTHAEIRVNGVCASMSPVLSLPTGKPCNWIWQIKDEIFRYHFVEPVELSSLSKSYPWSPDVPYRCCSLSQHSSGHAIGKHERRDELFRNQFVEPVEPLC